MLILNSGGTLNKRYNRKNGELEVPYDNNVLLKILKSCRFDYDLAGVIYKDSLEMDMNDRKIMASIIMESSDDTFVIVHGTDTMHITAEFLSEVFNDRKIILVGSMKPFSIDKVEASVNIGIAIGYAKAIDTQGVYICMNGYVEPWNKLVKNKEKGIFEIVE